MNCIYKYDRTMAYSSLYILIPTYYASNHAQFIMIIQTIFSILHWKYYSNKFFHNTDIYLSSYIFAYHLLLLYSIEIYYKKLSILFSLLTAIAFYYKKGYRERAIVDYKIIYVLPHTIFRYFAFWFVMSVYEKDFNISFSLLYWLNIIALAYF